MPHSASPSANAGAPELPAQWNLPEDTMPRLRTELGRALRRRCPYCGEPGIFSSWWTLKDQCPHCGVSFVREDGYFLGAYAINLVLAEFLGLGIALYLVFGTRLGQAPLLWQSIITAALVFLFPIVLFPFSRTIWMAIDLTANPPGQNPEAYLRGQHVLGAVRPPE